LLNVNISGAVLALLMHIVVEVRLIIEYLSRVGVARRAWLTKQHPVETAKVGKLSKDDR